MKAPCPPAAAAGGEEIPTRRESRHLITRRRQCWAQVSGAAPLTRSRDRGLRLRGSSRKWPDPKRRPSACPSARRSASPPARYPARLGSRRRPAVSVAWTAVEQLAMASFISVQLKKTSEVDLAKPLVKFIQQTYPNGGEEQAQYCRAAEELSKLRRAALGRPLDKHEGALETLLRWAWGCAGRLSAACRPPSLLHRSFLSLPPTAPAPARPPRPGLAGRVGVVCIPSWWAERPAGHRRPCPLLLPALPQPSVRRGSVDRIPGRKDLPRTWCLLPRLPRTSFLHFWWVCNWDSLSPVFGGNHRKTFLVRFGFHNSSCWREVGELGHWNTSVTYYIVHL